MVEPATILAAAQQVIRDRGMAGCTTREIAQVAGCSEGSIYNHFASKDDLVARAVGDRSCAFPAQLHGLVERAGTADVESNLTDLARAAIGFFHLRLPLLGAMIAGPESMRARVRAIDAQGHGPRRAVQAVVEYLRCEQELGRVRAGAAVEAAALCLLGGCFQQALLGHVFGPEAALLDDDTVATELVRSLMPGLRAPRAPGQE